MMIPPVIILLPLPQFLLMNRLGWIDTYYALIVPGLCSAYGTFLLRQFFMTLPSEMEDAAIVDGCNRLQIYWKIILPSTKPALADLGIFTFIASWNNLLWLLIVTNSEKMARLPLGLSRLSMGGEREPRMHLGILMAATASVIVPIIIVFIIAQKYLIKD